MNSYMLTAFRGAAPTVISADSISSNMAGALFFHRKTGVVTKNSLPKEIDARDVIEETEVVEIFAPGKWRRVWKQL